MSGRTPAQQALRGRTALIKSVSIFLASGRRASQASKSRHPTDAGPSTKDGKLRKRMADDTSSKSSTAVKCSAKTIELLKRKTHFSRQEIEALFRLYRKLVNNYAVNIIPTTGSSSTVAGPSVPSQQPSLCEGLDRSEFRELLHNTFDLVTEDILMDRIFCAFDRSNIGAVGLEEWVCGLCVFLFQGLDRSEFRELLHNTFDLVTEDILMDRIFCAFDRNNIGAVGLEEWVCGLSVFLRGTFDEKTAFCFLVYDLNNDGYISREEMFHLLRNCLMKQPQDEDPDEGVKDLVELALRKLDMDNDGKVSFQDFQVAVREEPLLLEAFGQCLPAENTCLTFLSTLRK